MTMRIGHATGCALALAVAMGGGACGEAEDHVNRERPPSSINVTAAILEGQVKVSPRRFGAGPIRLIVSNQTRSAKELTFETGGKASGVTQTTRPILPLGTATLEVDAQPGDYEIRTSDGDVAPASVTVGAPRESAQHELLTP